MITYQEELLTEALLKESEPLARQYYQDLVPEHDLPYDLNVGQYLGAQDHGNVVFVSCRDDGKIVGGILFFVMPYLYSRRKMIAIEEWFYLDEQYRKGFAGIKLLKTAERVLKLRGVDIINVICKAHQDKTALYERLGYRYTEKHFSKLV